jgi:hypothetical protein
MVKRDRDFVFLRDLILMEGLELNGINGFIVRSVCNQKANNDCLLSTFEFDAVPFDLLTLQQGF